MSSHFVGVVSVDFSEVFKENSLSVGIFKLVGEDDAVLGFPGIEFGGLGDLLVAEEDGSGTNEGNNDGKLLSSHDFIMKSGRDELHLSYHGRIIHPIPIF